MVLDATWEFNRGCLPATLILLHVGPSSWLLELPYSMVARFQVRGHSSHQPFSRVGPELPLHHFHYILLIRIVDDPVKIQGDREVCSISHCVCVSVGQGGGGWLQQILAIFNPLKYPVKRLAKDLNKCFA